VQSNGFVFVVDVEDVVEIAWEANASLCEDVVILVTKMNQDFQVVNVPQCINMAPPACSGEANCGCGVVSQHHLNEVGFHPRSASFCNDSTATTGTTTVARARARACADNHNHNHKTNSSSVSCSTCSSSSCSTSTSVSDSDSDSDGSSSGDVEITEDIDKVCIQDVSIFAGLINYFLAQNNPLHAYNSMLPHIENSNNGGNEVENERRNVIKFLLFSQLSLIMWHKRYARLGVFPNLTDEKPLHMFFYYLTKHENIWFSYNDMMLPNEYYTHNPNMEIPEVNDDSEEHEDITYERRRRNLITDVMKMVDERISQSQKNKMIQDLKMNIRKHTVVNQGRKQRDIIPIPEISEELKKSIMSTPARPFILECFDKARMVGPIIIDRPTSTSTNTNTNTQEKLSLSDRTYLRYILPFHNQNMHIYGTLECISLFRLDNVKLQHKLEMASKAVKSSSHPSRDMVNRYNELKKQWDEEKVVSLNKIHQSYNRIIEALSKNKNTQTNEADLLEVIRRYNELYMRMTTSTSDTTNSNNAVVDMVELYSLYMTMRENIAIDTSSHY
jgi:hypothetical protein